MLFALCASAADAQQPAKVPRIGFLGFPSPSANAARNEAFRQGLRELGYVEGKNIVIEWRFAEGKLDRASGSRGRASPSQGRCHRHRWSGCNASCQGSDGYDSYRHGAGSRSCWQWVCRQSCATWGNITGLSTLAPELSGKQLELLKEIIPKLSRVAVLGTSTSPANAQALKEVELAAGALRCSSIPRHSSPKDIETRIPDRKQKSC